MEKKSVSITKKPGEEPKKVKTWDAKKYFWKKTLTKVLPFEKN
jgi:hypothetical protein